jgi:hypothetical protein
MYCSRRCQKLWLREHTLTAADMLRTRTAIDGDHVLWTGNLGRGGYGRLSLHIDGVSRIRSAHHSAWELRSGEKIPKGMMIGHTCDIRACVQAVDEGTYEVDGILYRRFGHLWLGTVAANNRDRTIKQRQARGATNGNAKLSEADVLSIRQRRREGVLTGVLAAEYRVGRTTIQRIVRGTNWGHI